MGSSITKDKRFKALSLLMLLLTWKALSALVDIEIILPSPESTFGSLYEIVRSPVFWPAVGSTIMRGLKGFCISLALGLVAGLLAGFNTYIFAFLQPLVTGIRSVPTMSIILLALIWFPSNGVAVFVCFLITFPILYTNILEGVKSVDLSLVTMSNLYRVKRWRVIWELYLPGITPYLLAGISTALGLTWKVVVSAEVLSQPQPAIGTEMETAKMYLQTSRVLAWTLIAVVLSYSCETVLRFAEKRLKPWEV